MVFQFHFDHRVLEVARFVIIGGVAYWVITEFVPAMASTHTRFSGGRTMPRVDGRPTERDYRVVGGHSWMSLADLRATFKRRLLNFHPDRVVVGNIQSP